MACCSDKGTTHVFGMHRTNSSCEEQKQKSLSSRFLTMVMAGELPKSISQIRGLAHPTACAFLPDQPHTLAVVGWDETGHGVLVVADFGKEEAVRRAYHYLAKVETEEDPLVDMEARRRKRMTPQKRMEATSQLFVEDHTTQQIIFTDDDDGFLNVNAFEDDDNNKRHEEEQAGQSEPERVQ